MNAQARSLVSSKVKEVIKETCCCFHALNIGISDLSQNKKWIIFYAIDLPLDKTEGGFVFGMILYVFKQ
jgi:hypothetical protein